MYCLKRNQRPCSHEEEKNEENETVYVYFSQSRLVLKEKEKDINGIDERNHNIIRLFFCFLICTGFFLNTIVYVVRFVFRLYAGTRKEKGKRENYGCITAEIRCQVEAHIRLSVSLFLSLSIFFYRLCAVKRKQATTSTTISC